MRKIRFSMIGEIEIYDEYFADGMTDVDKVEIDVSRGNTHLKILDTKILHGENTRHTNPVPPIIHICKKKF